MGRAHQKSTQPETDSFLIRFKKTNPTLLSVSNRVTPTKTPARSARILDPIRRRQRDTPQHLGGLRRLNRQNGLLDGEGVTKGETND